MRTINDLERKGLKDLACHCDAPWRLRATVLDRDNRMIVTCFNCSSAVFEGIVLSSRPDQILEAWIGY